MFSRYFNEIHTGSGHTCPGKVPTASALAKYLDQGATRRRCEGRVRESADSYGQKRLVS